MHRILDLSVRFGLTADKVSQICEYLGVAVVDDVERDPEFERIARSVQRGRVTAYHVAWTARCSTEEQLLYLLNLSEQFTEAYEAAQLVNLDPIPNVRKLLDSEDYEAFGRWVVDTLTKAEKPVTHNYLAGRLLIALPVGCMKDYPKRIASLLNKARARGYLEGWYRLTESEGKRTVIYGKQDLDL